MGTIFDSSFWSFPALDYDGSKTFKSFGQAVDFEAGSVLPSQWQHEKEYCWEDSLTGNDMPELSSRPSSRNSSRPSSLCSGSKRSSSSRSELPEDPMTNNYLSNPRIFDDSLSIGLEPRVWQGYSGSLSSPLSTVTSYDPNLYPCENYYSPTTINIAAPELFNPWSDLLLDAKPYLPSRPTSCDQTFTYQAFSDNFALRCTSTSGPSIHRKDLVEDTKSAGVPREKTSLFNRSKEWPDKCPIVACEYHIKGFRRKYDQHRHTLTHFKGSIVCYFCPCSKANVFSRVNVFKRHLSSIHGVQNTSQHIIRKNSNSKAKVPSSKQSQRSSPPAQGLCSICFAAWDIQDFSKHLDDCIITSVLKQASFSPSGTEHTEQALFKTHEWKNLSPFGDYFEHNQNYDTNFLTVPHPDMELRTTENLQAYLQKLDSKPFPDDFRVYSAPATRQKRTVSAIFPESVFEVTEKREKRRKARRFGVGIPTHPDPYFNPDAVLQDSLCGAHTPIDEKSRYCLYSETTSCLTKNSSFSYEPQANSQVQHMSRCASRESYALWASDKKEYETNGNERSVSESLRNENQNCPSHISEPNSEIPHQSPKACKLLNWEGQPRSRLLRKSPSVPKSKTSTNYHNLNVSAENCRFRHRAPLRYETQNRVQSLAYEKELPERAIEKESDLMLSNSPDRNASIAEVLGQSFTGFASSPETELSEETSDNESISDCSTEWGDEQGQNSPNSNLFWVLVSSKNNETKEGKNLLKPALSPMKQALVDRIMTEFWTIVNQEWAANLTKCDGDTPVSSSPPGNDMSSNGESPPRFNNGKRQRDEGEEPPPENNDGRAPKRPTSCPDKSLPKNGVKFGCPYRKHAPHTYTIYKHRSCALSHWDTVARLKEHLYRRHKVPIQCKRCWKTFKAQEELDAHLTVVDICQLRPGQATEGLTADLEKRLRSRKKSSPDQTEAARWKEIYGMLFPNEVVPSPYFEPVQENVVQSPDTRELADYEEFSRQQLPKFFRSYLEDAVNNETQPLEEHIRSQLVNIVQDCQDRMFLAYKSRVANKDSKATTDDTTIGACATSQAPVPTISVPDQALEFGDCKSKDIVASAYQAPPPTLQSTMQCVPGLQDIPSKGSLSQLPKKNNFSDSGYSSNGTENSQRALTKSQTQDFSLPKAPHDLYNPVSTAFSDTPIERLAQDLDFYPSCQIPLDFNDPEWNWPINYEPEV